MIFVVSNVDRKTFA